MKSADTEQRARVKSGWFPRQALWLPRCILTTESAASICRCRTLQLQRHRYRNPEKRKLFPQASFPPPRKILPRKTGSLNLVIAEQQAGWALSYLEKLHIRDYSRSANAKRLFPAAMVMYCLPSI